MIGYEFEFFAIDSKTFRPINGKQFDQIHKSLAKLGWKNEYDPVSKAINYSKKGKIALKTDVVLHIFELNMPPKETIEEARNEFRKIASEVNNEATKAGEIAEVFLKLAQKGLENSDKKYLEIALKRAKNKMNLCQENLEIFKKEGIRKMIEKNLLNS